MKISASVCPAIKVPFSFYGSIKHTLPTLRRLGYDGVELLLRRSDDVEVREIERILSKYELEISAVGTGLATLDRLTLSSPEEVVRSKAVRRVLDISRFAQRFECPVILGSILAGVSMKHTPKSLRKSLTELRDIYAVIEPLNRYESAFINKASEALSLIEDLNLDHFGILLDTFHMNIEEKELSDAVRKASSKLRHFHVADSNRLAPGEGHIGFDGVFHALREVGYRGFVSVEVLQSPSSEDALKKAIVFIRRFSSL